MLDLADLHVRKLIDAQGPNSNPKWSPDGKQIAYATYDNQPFFYYANRYIAAISVEGGTPEVLTRDFDEDANLLDWGPDGIYFTALQKTNAHIYRLDPGTRTVHRITGPDAFHAAGASFTKDHRTFAGTGAAPNHFAEIYVSSATDFAPRYLTATGAQYKSFTLAHREVVEWKSSDGATVEGILIKPADYDPSRKYPLLVVIHGGPTGVDTPLLAADRYYPVERFAAKGALILRAELSRIGRIRRQVPRPQRAQPGHRRLRGCHFRRRFPDRQGLGGQRPRRFDGMERRRLYLGFHYLLQRPV